VSFRRLSQIVSRRASDHLLGWQHVAHAESDNAIALGDGVHSPRPASRHRAHANGITTATGLPSAISWSVVSSLRMIWYGRLGSFIHPPPVSGAHALSIPHPGWPGHPPPIRSRKVRNRARLVAVGSSWTRAESNADRRRRSMPSFWRSAS